MNLSRIPTFFGLLVVFAFAADTTIAQTVYDFSNVDVAIPDADPNGATNTQAIFDTGTITDVDVDLHITHTWQGDLIVTLEHNGITVPLLFRAGASDGGGFGFSADNFGTDANRFILDDEAASAYDLDTGWGDGTVTGGGDADVTGSWIPYGVFSSGGSGGLGAFDGQDVSGNWTLFVSDNASGDTGMINSWSLHVTTAVPEPSSVILLLGMGGLAFVRRRR